MRKSSFRRFLATRAHLAAAVVLIGCGLYAFQPHASEFFDTSGMPRHATTFVEQQIVALIAGHKPGNLADAAFIQRKLGKYYADQGDEARAERAFILAANADDALMPHSGDPEPRAARPDGVAMTRTDPPQTGKLPGSYYGYEGRTLHTWDFSADGTLLHTWIATAAEEIGITFPTVAAAIDHMHQLGMIREITGKQRGRLFAYGGYLDILNEGTEPLRP